MRGSAYAVGSCAYQKLTYIPTTTPLVRATRTVAWGRGVMQAFGCRYTRASYTRTPPPTTSLTHHTSCPRSVYCCVGRGVIAGACVSRVSRHRPRCSPFRPPPSSLRAIRRPWHRLVHIHCAQMLLPNTTMSSLTISPLVSRFRRPCISSIAAYLGSLPNHRLSLFLGVFFLAPRPFLATRLSDTSSVIVFVPL